MIDPISISVAIGAIIVAIISHIKTSKCWGVEIETRKLNNNKVGPMIPNEETTLIIPSTPIPIPAREKVKKNYL